MTNLEELDLGDCEVLERIVLKQPLPKLCVVELPGTGITDLSWVEFTPALRSLLVSGCSIRRGLDRLLQLEWLDCLGMEGCEEAVGHEFVFPELHRRGVRVIASC